MTGYTHTNRGTIVLTPAIYNADHQNHVDNNIPEKIDDYSSDTSEMRERVDPGESGTESRPTNLAGEIQRLRNIIYELGYRMKGDTVYWYESPGVVPAILVTMAGTQVVSTATETVVNFDTANTDTLSDYDTLNHKWTPSVPGYYWISAQVRWTAGLDGSSYHLDLRKNGTAERRGTTAPHSTAILNVGVNAILYANGSTDYFDVSVQHNTGSNKSIDAGTTLSFLNGGRLT